MTDELTSIQPELVDYTGLDGVPLRADRWQAPDAKGTAILLHGGGQTRHSWHRTGERLAAAGWTTINLDARGHGDSGWSPDGDYRHDKLVGDLLEVIDQIGTIPVLVGASMGGSTSLVAAGEHADKVRALVLVDIVPRVEQVGAERITSFMRGAPDGFETLDDVAAAITAYNPHRKSRPSHAGLRKNVRQRENGRWYWHWDPAFLAPLSGGDEPRKALGYERTMNAARNIAVPTLLVRGTESDIVSKEGVQELLGAVPGARYVDIVGAGHMVAGDDNDVFSTAVLDFLDDV